MTSEYSWANNVAAISWWTQNEPEDLKRLCKSQQLCGPLFRDIIIGVWILSSRYWIQTSHFTTSSVAWQMVMTDVVKRVTLILSKISITTFPNISTNYNKIPYQLMEIW